MRFIGRIALLALLVIPARGDAEGQVPLIPEDASPYIFLAVSETDCGRRADHSSEPWLGQRALYVWICGGFNDFAQTEFGIDTDFEIVDLIPRSGVVNIGTVTSPVLVYPQCETFHLLAELVVEDTTGEGGAVCLVDSTPNEINCTQDCYGSPLSNNYLGFSSNGTAPCEGLSSSCGTVSVGNLGWGSVKSRYR